MASRGRSCLALVLVLAGASTAPALAARVDRTPIPDDVVRTVAHEPLRRHAGSAPRRLERKLDETLALLDRMDTEERRRAVHDGDPPAMGTTHMLLGAKLHELQAIREELAAEATAIRRAIDRDRRGARAVDHAKSRAIDDQFEHLEKVLTRVERSSTTRERRAALAAARALLRSLHDRRKEREAGVTPVPVLRLQRAATASPPVVAAPPPAYARTTPRAPLYAAVAAAGSIEAATPVPGQEGICEYAPEDLGQIPATSRVETRVTEEIQDLADRLGRSPARIYEYVSNQIAFEPYWGSLKGATGTLYAGAGNATDHASLLIALLRASGVPARYVKGRVRFGLDARVLDWLGAKDYPGAAEMLRQGGIPNVEVGTDHFGFLHVWAEACVPYTRYRGSGADAAGHRWVPLDASFKEFRYRPGIPSVRDHVLLDYGAYLSARADVLPLERYTEQAEEYARTLDPSNTAADIPYAPTLVPRLIDVTPAWLPYEVVQFVIWGGQTSSDVAEVSDNHRHTLDIALEDGTSPEITADDGVSCVNPIVIDEVTYCLPATASVRLMLPDVVLRRITVSFDGVTLEDRAVLDAWKTSVDPALGIPCQKPADGSSIPLLVRPSVRVDGQDWPMSGTPPAVGLCTTNHRLTVRIGVADGTPGNGNTVRFRNIQPAAYYAIFAYAFQASDRLLAERSRILLDNVRRTPDPNTDLDATEGELLHLVGLKYLRHMTDAFRSIGALHGVSGQSGHHIGIVAAQMKVGYAFDEPFAVYRRGFLVDFPGMWFRAVDLATGELNWHAFKLGAYEASAYESFVWQETLRLDAVSTVRGLQFARESGVDLVTITRDTKQTELPKLTDYLDVEKATIESEVDKGFTILVPAQRLTYGDWSGAVWIQELRESGRFAIGAFIGGGYKGGLTVLEALQANIVFELALPPPPVDDILSTLRFGNGRDQGTGPLVIASGDPVNLVTGNLYHAERDITIKGRGLPIVFERHYNSRAPSDGPLGFGWTHSFNHALVFDDEDATGARDGLTSTITWFDGAGAAKLVTVAGDAGGVPIGAMLRTPPGLSFSMTRAGDGTYTIRERNGLTYTFESLAGTPGQRARLVRIEDRNGNGLTLTYDPSTGRLASVRDDVAACPGATCRSLAFDYDAAGRIQEIRDWSGRRYQYRYDALGNLTEYRNPLVVNGLQPPVRYEYYAEPPFQHAMRRYVLPRGNSMTFEYYANGKVFRHSTTLGETTTFRYNGFRRETTVVNERGHARHFFFDRHGNPVKIIEENGAERVYTYDDPSNPINRTSERSPLGHVTRYCYDTDGRVTRVILPSAPSDADCRAASIATHTIEYGEFNTFGQPGRVKDARGNVTLAKYDDRGNVLETLKLKAGVTAIADPSAPKATEVVAWTISTYDSFGNVTSTRQVKDLTTASGPAIEYGYDDRVNGVTGLNAVSLTKRRADGVVHATAALEYDVLGRLRKGVRPDWYPTSFEYDAVDRVTAATDDFGKLRDHGYDENGNLVRTTLRAGGAVVDETTFAYDESDRRVATMDAGGFITNVTYDTAGNVVAVANPDGFVKRFEHDENHRVIAESDPEGHRVVRMLDVEGKTRSITDANGSTVRYSYYGAEKGGRVRAVTDPRTTVNASGVAEPAGRVTHYDYDEAGNVTVVRGAPTLEEPAGRTTLTDHDELNRPVRVAGPQYTDPERGVVRPLTTYQYDLLGRLEQIHAGHAGSGGDELRRQVTYVWDDFGGKIRELDGAGRAWDFQPDVHGNATTVTDPKRQATVLTYEYGGRLKTRTDAANRVTTYDRNHLGQVLSVRGPDVTYTYTYGQGHRLETVTDSRAAKRLSYEWSPGGLLNAVEDSDGNRTDYVYDAAGRLTGIWAPNDDLVTFVYDPGGRLAQKWLPNGAATIYTYNSDNTVARIVNSAGTTVVSEHAYAYDDAGHRTAHEETVDGQRATYEYGYDPLGRLLEVRNASAVPAGLETYAYDPFGNRVRKTNGADTLTYVHDAETHQLSEVRRGTTTAVSFAYDANGSLVTKTEAGVTTALEYDALNRLAVVRRSAGPGALPESYVYDDQGRRIRKTVGATVTNYLYDGQNIAAQYGASWGNPTALFTHGAAIDAPLTRIAGTTREYYHQDALGTVVGVSDPAGAVTGTARFDAWGNRAGGSGAVPVYGYTGREPDDTGLVYYRARYYDPSIGRFTQRDPIGVSGGLNPYLYAAANPVQLTDPMGTSPTDPVSIAQSIATGTYVGSATAAGGVMSSGSQRMPPGPGQLYRVDLDPVTRAVVNVGEAHAADTGVVAVNGIWNTRDEALRNLVPQVLQAAPSATAFTLFYNPTAGFFADLWEATRDKLGLTTDVARQFAGLAEQIQIAGTPTLVVAHSQGGLIVVEGVRFHNATRGSPLSKLSVVCYGCAANELVARQIFATAGVSAAKDAFPRNLGDLVPDVLALNTLNPIRIVAAILGIPALFMGQLSPHKYP